MFDWIIKISASAIILSIVSYMLPVGKIRVAALISLGFLFLTMIIFPLKDIISELGNKRASIETQKNILLSQIEKDDYEGYREVIKVYKERLKTEINMNITDKSYYLKDININVNEDFSSSSFGSVENVVAVASVQKQENSQNKIDAVVVPDIVIDRNGISIKKENFAENSENMTKYEKEIIKIINKITGVEESHILIRWEK